MYRADSLSVHYATENGEQSTPLENGFAGGSVTRNRPQTRVNTRKKHPSFDGCFLVEISGIEPLTS